MSAFEFSGKINSPALASRVGGAIHDTLPIMQVVSGDACLNISNDETLTAMEELARFAAQDVAAMHELARKIGLAAN